MQNEEIVEDVFKTYIELLRPSKRSHSSIDVYSELNRIHLKVAIEQALRKRDEETLKIMHSFIEEIKLKVEDDTRIYMTKEQFIDLIEGIKQELIGAKG